MRSTAAFLLVLLLPLAGCTSLQEGPALHEALLLRHPHPILVVEVHHVEGLAPHPGALDAMLGALLELTDKTRVVLVGPSPIGPQGAQHSPSDVLEIHRSTTGPGPRGPGEHGVGEVAFLHVLYLDGHLVRGGRDAHAAGTHFASHGLLVVFPETFQHAHRLFEGRAVGVAAEVERTVLLHELGHALGLVAKGVPASGDRVHADGPGHSSNPASVMYPRLPLSTDGAVGALPPGFDAHDKADLRAFVAARSLV